MGAAINSAIAYSSWKEEYKSVLGGFTGKRVFLLFSGGKDSSLAMDLLLRAGKEFGFRFDAHTGVYPVHRYPDNEREKLESYWIKRGATIVWHDMGKADDLIENDGNPCVSCQKLRKKMLNTTLTSSVEDWGSLVIVISHTLWDIVSYSVENMLGEVTFEVDQGVGAERNRRFMETAQRFYPLLMMKEGYTVFRPLIRYNNNDIMQVIARKGIPTLSTPCRFEQFRPKRILETYYHRMGIHFDYDKVFDFAKRSLGLPGTSAYVSVDKDVYLQDLF